MSRIAVSRCRELPYNKPSPGRGRYGSLAFQGLFPTATGTTTTANDAMKGTALVDRRTLDLEQRRRQQRDERQDPEVGGEMAVEQLPLPLPKAEVPPARHEAEA